MLMVFVTPDSESSWRQSDTASHNVLGWLNFLLPYHFRITSIMHRSWNEVTKCIRFARAKAGQRHLGEIYNLR